MILLITNISATCFCSASKGKQLFVILYVTVILKLRFRDISPSLKKWNTVDAKLWSHMYFGHSLYTCPTRITQRHIRSYVRFIHHSFLNELNFTGYATEINSILHDGHKLPSDVINLFFREAGIIQKRKS